jgi:hypothetical protein
MHDKSSISGTTSRTGGPDLGTAGLQHNGQQLAHLRLVVDDHHTCRPSSTQRAQHATAR